MRKLLTERTDISRVITETPAESGLDPNLYLAVLSAELGIAGRVNSNGRIYEVDDFVLQNRRLSERLETEFVDGEAGHPEGSPTFDVPVRLVGVSINENGATATAKGRFAVVNTQAGRDILTLYKAGMPIGVSSRGTGILEQEVIDESSVYYDANQDYDGETVSVVKEFELDRYDLVRVPSAGTHVESTQEAREALARLTESGFISQNKEDANMSDTQTESVDLELESAIEVPAQESIDIEKIRQEAFEAASAELHKNDPLAELNTEQKAIFLRIAEALTVSPEKAGEVDLVQEVSLIRQEMIADREKTAVAEREYTALREEVETLRGERDERIRQDAIEAAIQSCTSEKKHSARVQTQLRGLLSDGVIENAESVSSFADRFFALAESIKNEIDGATGVAVIEAEDIADDNLDGTSEATTTEGPGLLNEQFHEQIKKILERDRLVLGKGN